MNFVKLGDKVYLNLDAVASISWSGEGPDLCVTVNNGPYREKNINITLLDDFFAVGL